MQVTQAPLTPAEHHAVETCLGIIRGCQLPDGAFRQMDMGGAPDSPVWIPPYFASYAALALLAAHQYKKGAGDRERVGRWLMWCVQNQARDGYWDDFTGTVGAYQQGEKPVDAWDSSAAMFLLVLGRYRRAGGRSTPALNAAARRALACLEAVTDKHDGLTWATPTYRVKFLEDTIEVYAGLQEAAVYFSATGMRAEARRSRAQAAQIAQKLLSFWSEADGRFAPALHESGSLDRSPPKAYPHGQAQLFGIAFVCPKASAWKAAQSFPADTTPDAALGSERWMVAAARLDAGERKAWRAKAVNDALGFTPKKVYIYRPSLLVLGLLEDADWMPSIARDRQTR